MAKRLITHPVSRKQPLKLDNIQKLSSNATWESASLFVGFTGFLRWNDLSNIKVENVKFYTNHMSILFLEKRKNDQFKREQYLDIARFEKHIFQVSSMEHFLACSGLRQGPLHKEVKGSGRKLQQSLEPLSYQKARKFVLDMFNKIGLDTKTFGLHSLRSGGASAAAKSGVKDRLISSWWPEKCFLKELLHRGWHNFAFSASGLVV